MRVFLKNFIFFALIINIVHNTYAENFALITPVTPTKALQTFQTIIQAKVQEKINSIIIENKTLKTELRKKNISVKARPVEALHLTHLSIENVNPEKISCITNEVTKTVEIMRAKLENSREIFVRKNPKLKLLDNFVVLALEPEKDIAQHWFTFAHTLDKSLEASCKIIAKRFTSWIPHISLLRITPRYISRDTKEALLDRKFGEKTMRELIEEFLKNINQEHQKSSDKTREVIMFDTIQLTKIISTTPPTFIVVTEFMVQPNVLANLITSLEKLKQTLAQLSSTLFTLKAKS